MSFKVKNLLAFLFAVLTISSASAEIVGSLTLDPGEHKLEGEKMSGIMGLARMRFGHIAYVSLTLKYPPHGAASIEGVATIKGRKITIKSADNDDEIVITLRSKSKLTIKATGGTNKNCGEGASFDGEYTYKSATP